MTNSTKLFIKTQSDEEESEIYYLNYLWTSFYLHPYSAPVNQTAPKGIFKNSVYALTRCSTGRTGCGATSGRRVTAEKPTKPMKSIPVIFVPRDSSASRDWCATWKASTWASAFPAPSAAPPTRRRPISTDTSRRLTRCPIADHDTATVFIDRVPRLAVPRPSGVLVLWLCLICGLQYSIGFCRRRSSKLRILVLPGFMKVKFCCYHGFVILRWSECCKLPLVDCLRCLF